MRHAAATSSGLRRLGFFASGDGDADPDVDTQDPTSGQTVVINLNHTQFNRHNVAFDGIVLSDPDSIVLEFQRASDDVWEQGASDYRIMELGSSGKTNPVDAANMPAGDYDAGRGPIHGVFYITNAGLAVPTCVQAVEWDNLTELHCCKMNNLNLHKSMRFRIVGSETYVSGSIVTILGE